MVVRLLPKSEIDKRKAEEQRLAITEGIKVAERVDLLRETAATEEVAFEKYRTESLKEIQAEIDEKMSLRDSLEDEISAKRKERRELELPLIHKWEEVNRAQKMCTDWEVDLKKTDLSLREKEEKLSVLQKETTHEVERVENLKKLASAMFSQAEAVMATAKEESAQMRNKAQAELSLIELQKEEVRSKSAAILIREQALEDREGKIEKYEIDLAYRELLLREGWKELEKTQIELHVN